MLQCARVCECVWDKFSEFLPENRVPTSADFNTYPIRIFYLLFFAYQITQLYSLVISVCMKIIFASFWQCALGFPFHLAAAQCWIIVNFSLIVKIINQFSLLIQINFDPLLSVLIRLSTSLLLPKKPKLVRTKLANLCTVKGCASLPSFW